MEYMFQLTIHIRFWKTTTSTILKVSNTSEIDFQDIFVCKCQSRFNGECCHYHQIY